jgi:hypothetical protein
MPSEPTILHCGCGACYERRERVLPIKDIGLFACELCGERVEIWSGRTVPLFKRIESPTPQQRRA